MHAGGITRQHTRFDIHTINTVDKKKDQPYTRRMMHIVNVIKRKNRYNTWYLGLAVNWCQKQVAIGYTELDLSLNCGRQHVFPLLALPATYLHPIKTAVSCTSLHIHIQHTTPRQNPFGSYLSLGFHLLFSSTVAFPTAGSLFIVCVSHHLIIIISVVAATRYNTMICQYCISQMELHSVHEEFLCIVDFYALQAPYHQQSGAIVVDKKGYIPLSSSDRRGVPLFSRTAMSS